MFEDFSRKNLLRSAVDLVLIPVLLQVSFSLLLSPVGGLIAVSLYGLSRTILLASRSRGVPHRFLLAVSILRLTLILLLASPTLWAFQGLVQTFLTGSVVAAAGASGRTALIERAAREVSLSVPSLALRHLALLWGGFQIALSILNAALFTVLPVAVYLSIRPIAGFVMNGCMIATICALSRRRAPHLSFSSLLNRQHAAVTA